MTTTATPPLEAPPKPTKKTNFFTKPVPRWKSLVASAIAVVVVGVMMAAYVAGLLTPPWVKSAVESYSVVRNEQVVTSLEKKEQTVLLELGAQGISEAQGIPPAMLKDFPLLKKARFVLYKMKVKLGVDAVKIKATADHEFEVAVPKFIWIGEQDRKIERVLNADGILSAFTSQTSEVDQLNAIVDESLKRQYLTDNEQALRDQTELVFTKLARNIDPDAELTFVYEQ